MTEDMANRAGAWTEPLTHALTNLTTGAAEWAPRVLGALILLLAGWCIARSLAWIVTGGLERVGLDAASRRFAGDAFQRIGFDGSVSGLAGRAAFWIVMLAFLMGVADILGLAAVTGTIERLFAYLPNVLSAAVIVVLGVSVARVAGDVVSSGAQAANLSYARQLGSCVRGAFVVMVIVTVLEQLGVNTRILQTVITALLAMIVLGLGLSFAIGSRDVVRAILAGHYIRQSLEEGSEVTVNGRRGRVLGVGSVETLFEDDRGAWSVPNAQLLQEVIERPA